MTTSPNPTIIWHDQARALFAEHELSVLEGTHLPELLAGIDEGHVRNMRRLEAQRKRGLFAEHDDETAAYEAACKAQHVLTDATYRGAIDGVCKTRIGQVCRRENEVWLVTPHGQERFLGELSDDHSVVATSHIPEMPTQIVDTATVGDATHAAVAAAVSRAPDDALHAKVDKLHELVTSLLSNLGGAEPAARIDEPAIGKAHE